MAKIYLVIKICVAQRACLFSRFYVSAYMQLSMHASGCRHHLIDFTQEMTYEGVNGMQQQMSCLTGANGAQMFL